MLTSGSHRVLPWQKVYVFLFFAGFHAGSLISMQKQGWEIASSLKKKECKDTKDTLYKGCHDDAPVNLSPVLQSVWRRNLIATNVSVKSKLQHPPPGHLTFLKIIVQIPPYPGQNTVQMPHPGDISQAQKWQKDGRNVFQWSSVVEQNLYKIEGAVQIPYL